LHIPGGKNGGKMKEAIAKRSVGIAAIQRRNLINKLKFHCIEQTFLSEFTGCRNFNFLKDIITFYD
jgi:hypothetical protein